MRRYVNIVRIMGFVGGGNFNQKLLFFAIDLVDSRTIFIHNKFTCKVENINYKKLDERSLELAMNEANLYLKETIETATIQNQRTNYN